MRVYISVDMEGIAGVSHAAPTRRGDSGYPAAVRAHGRRDERGHRGCLRRRRDRGRGQRQPRLDVQPDARRPSTRGPGWSRAASRTAWSRRPPDGRFDVALFVGYHARAGHPRGTIAHTYTGDPTLTTLNGRPVGEYGINGLYLGALGVPVGMVAGDDALADEVAEWLPWAERVVVKRGVSRMAADSVHPSVARELIAAASRRAVERAGARRAASHWSCRRPSAWASSSIAAARPTSRPSSQASSRIGDRGVRYEAARRHRGVPGVRGRGPDRGPRQRLTGPRAARYAASTTARRSARSAMRDIGSPTTSSRIDQTCGGESSGRYGRSAVIAS